MARETKDKGSSEAKPVDKSSRRNLLLAGTSPVTAAAINAVDSTQLAQAQQPKQPSRNARPRPTLTQERWSHA